MPHDKAPLYDNSPLDEANCRGEYDYVVIGSGAGGGPVAANLARAGFTVALVEAGGSDTPSSYEVPAFAPQATEDTKLSWNFFVRHYADSQQQNRDCKKVLIGEEPYVWYPRCGTLGGCTAHNQLVTIFPHDSDWNFISSVTKDNSWNASKMKRYWTRLERCTYKWNPPFGRPHQGGHGFTGWLSTSVAHPKLLTSDWKVFRIAYATLRTVIEGRVVRSLKYFWSARLEFPGSIGRLIWSFLDPNDLRYAAFKREGLFNIPFSTERGRRASVRDLINVTLQDHPDKLTIFSHTLATRVLFDRESTAALRSVRSKTKTRPSRQAGKKLTAVGVEFIEGLRLYRADASYLEEQSKRSTSCTASLRAEPLYRRSAPLPPRCWLRAKREVILAGGAFNSPQLLMLSGVGPEEELEANGIETLMHRPGVGKNLQDRYEVGVICKTKSDFAILRNATLRRPGVGEEPDPLFKKWLKGRGAYTTNGTIVGFTRRSDETLDEPDLVFFCVPGIFRGYFPGWSKEAFNKSHFTWLILKAHTENRGSVTLNCDDPRVPPEISFNYFGENSEADAEAMAFGIELVRRLNQKLSAFIQHEWIPGPEKSDKESLKRFVKDEAWGHHASCTNKMGTAEDQMAVVDSNFRVIGTDRLRVVDASVFPRIPGFFIVTPIYMIAEKASEVIIKDALQPQQDGIPNLPPRVIHPSARRGVRPIAKRSSSEV